VAKRSRSLSDLDSEIGSDGGIAHDAEKKFERQDVRVRCYNGYRRLLRAIGAATSRSSTIYVI